MLDNFNYGDKVYHKTLDKVGIFMDRIYTNEDYLVNSFKDYAIKHEMYYKEFQNSLLINQHDFKYGKADKIKLDIYVPVGDKLPSKYPFLDTIPYLIKYKDGYALTNNSENSLYKLQDDNGGDGSCTNCGGSGEIACMNCDDGELVCNECDGKGIEENGEECLNCGGEGYIECPECLGNGAYPCDICS